MRRRFAACLGMALLLLALALPSRASAAGEDHVVPLHGFSATATFESTDQTGCIVTDVSQNAKASGEIDAVVEQVNQCTGERVQTRACTADSSSVQIHGLESAMVSGTLTCVDSETEEPICALSKSETFAGVGPVTSEQFREEGLVARFIVRAASVTSASIMGCGVSLTEANVQQASLVVTSGANISGTH